MPACQVHSESLTTGSNQEFTSDASGTLLYVSLLGISARTRTHTHTHTHTHTERHTGPILWLQQFWAMILKRFYNSLRFYVAIITQLILPLVFLGLALLIVKIPNPDRNPQDDPRRVLTLRHSSLSEKAEAFLVQFSPIFGFQVIFLIRHTY